jgi:molybdopterin converting factor small subunit
MRVTVELYFPERRKLPREPLVLELPEGADVTAAVEALVERFPFLRTRLYDGRGRLQRFVSALVDGTSIQFLRGFSTPLAEGSRLTLLPPVGGG